LPSLAAFPFIGVALLPFLLAWDEWARGIFSDPIDWFATWFLGTLPSLAIPLIGAAIVIRHPRARRTVPLLLFGAILLAIQIAGVRLYVPIGGLLSDPTFPNEPMFELYRAVYTVLAVVGAFGWAYLASGLVRARRYEEVGPTWIIVSAAVVAAVIPTALSAGAQDLTLGSTANGIVLMALAATGLVAGFAEKLALGYMAVTATRGWLAGEAPRRGWGLAAAGAWLLLVALLALSALPLFGDEWFQSYDPTWIFPAISLVYGAGGVALLAAFAMGLPDTQDITWYDLADLDAAALAVAPRSDPFDDDDDDAAGGDMAVFELGNRRLDR